MEVKFGNTQIKKNSSYLEDDEILEFPEESKVEKR